MKWIKTSEQKPHDGRVCLCKHLFFDLYNEYLVAYYDPTNLELPWVSFENNESRYSGEYFESWIYVLEIDKEASREVD